MIDRRQRVLRVGRRLTSLELFSSLRSPSFADQATGCSPRVVTSVELAPQPPVAATVRAPLVCRALVMNTEAPCPSVWRVNTDGMLTKPVPNRIGLEVGNVPKGREDPAVELFIDTTHPASVIRELEYQATFSFMTRLVECMDTIDGYVPGETSVAFLLEFHPIMNYSKNRRLPQLSFPAGHFDR